MGTKPRILVYHVGSIGDTIVAMPAFRTLRHNHPEAKITLLNLSVAANTVHANLYEHTDVFNKKYFMLPPKTFIGKILLYLKFLFVCMTGKYSALYCFSPGPPRLLSLFFRMIQRKKMKHCFLFPKGKGMPLYQAYLKNLKDDGLETPPDVFKFSVAPSEKSCADHVYSEIVTDDSTPLVAFGIGGNQQACLYPHYSELISKLKKHIRFIPVYLGSEHERVKAQELLACHGGVFLADTHCDTPRKTIAFLAKCRYYVGNDTGSAHMAAAAGIPCAILYSAHNLPAETWYPFGENNLYFRSAPDCAGCEFRVCPKGNPAPCLELYTKDDILNGILKWTATQ